MSGERVLSRVVLDSYLVEKAYLGKSAKDTAQPPIGETQLHPLQAPAHLEVAIRIGNLVECSGSMSDLVSEFISDLGGGGRFRFDERRKR